MCLLLSFLHRQHQESSKETSDISELLPASNQSDPKTKFMVCTCAKNVDFKCTLEMDIFLTEYSLQVFNLGQSVKPFQSKGLILFFC